MGTGLRNLLFVAAVLPGTAALAAAPIRSDQAVVSDDRNRFSQKFSLGKDVTVVDVRARAFQPAKHRIKIDEGGVQQVDGHRVLGLDGGPPELLKSEIASITVSWNGARHRVDRQFFADCFNSSAVPSRVLASDDLKAVMITLSGGDGAGAYEVTLIVSDDGSVRRFVNDELG